MQPAARSESQLLLFVPASMLQRDHLMRQIQQLADVIARVLFHKENRAYEEALEAIDVAGEQFLGLALGGATLSYGDLFSALQAAAGLDAHRASLIAELLWQQGTVFALQGRTDAAQHSFRLALQLYLDLYLLTPHLQSLNDPARIDCLLAEVRGADLPAPSQRALFRYYEAQGRFARAEDVLFRLAEEPDEALYADGMAFYERLRQQPDAQLSAGDLPRHEVEEGLAAFRARFPAPWRRL